MKKMADDLWFERLADATASLSQERAPARLKSKIYSALVTKLAESGRLLGLRETQESGRDLCVFEHALSVLPVGTDIRSMNPCRICHARVLGERLERAPIFWRGCPYSEFHNR
jgi:hypothetical protein